jgi:hypothetical protein
MASRRQRRFILFATGVVAFMVVVLIVEAADALRRGELMYYNAYLVPVFAPFAIIIGLLGFVVLLIVTVQALRSDRR